MKKTIQFFIYISSIALLAGGVQAASFVVPNTFTAGTPAVAAEVNENFSVIESEIQNNTSRLYQLEYLHKRQQINIDFGTHYNSPANAFSGAADQAGIWNQIGLVYNQTLLDINGVNSQVVITVTADIGTGYSSSAPTDDTTLLLNDNFYANTGGSWKVTLNGLKDGTYLLYLYAPAHAGVISGDMKINGMSVSSFPGGIFTLVEDTSYIIVAVAVAHNRLVISGTDAGYSGLSGLQIVP